MTRMWLLSQPNHYYHFGLTYIEMQINTCHQSCLSLWQTVTADCTFQWKVGKQKLQN